jgi:hypothetical protein
MVYLPKTVLVDGSGNARQHHHRRNDPAAYAYWIANHLMKERTDDIATDLYYSQDQVLFVQDSHQTIYHPRQVHDMSNSTTIKIKAKFRQLYDRSLQYGLSCGSTLLASALLVTPATTTTAMSLDKRCVFISTPCCSQCGIKEDFGPLPTVVQEKEF